MANIVEEKLTESLFHELQNERYAILTTIDVNTGKPNVNAISWVLAKDSQTMVFALASNSKLVENIRQTKYIALTTIANESTYTISGDAYVAKEILEGVPLKLALIEMSIKEVRDVMFYGAKMVNEPQYEKTYDKRAAEKLDIQVMEALKKGI